MVALATGTLPQNADEVYKMLMHAPSDGMGLSNNHGIANPHTKTPA